MQIWTIVFVTIKTLLQMLICKSIADLILVWCWRWVCVTGDSSPGQTPRGPPGPFRQLYALWLSRIYYRDVNRHPTGQSEGLTGQWEASQLSASLSVPATKYPFLQEYFLLIMTGAASHKTDQSQSFYYKLLIIYSNIIFLFDSIFIFSEDENEICL